MATTFILNGEEVTATASSGTLVLDWLRLHKRRTGTKEGCKEGDCGACSVMLGVLGEDGALRYRTMTSCLMPLGELAGRHLVTIEGVNLPAPALNPVQQAMVDQGGSQCGFCTPGFIVSMVWYMLGSQDERPNAEGMRHAISGNLCRCTGYGSIFRAIDDLVARLDVGGDLHGIWSADDRVAALAKAGLLPAYLAQAPAKVAAIQRPAPTDAEREAQPAFFIAGGTDLYVQRGEEIPDVSVEVLNQRDGYEFIEVEGGDVRVGSLTTFEDFASDARIQAMIPSIKDDMALIASLPIRNRATLSGNLINASPIGDMTNLLLALGTRIVLRAGPGSERELALEDLYIGYKTLAREPEELVIELRFPVIAEGDLVSFEKVSKRTWLDIATVNSGARLRVEGGVFTYARLALGGVAAVPLYLEAASTWLVGKPLDAESVRGAIEVAMGEISPISDVRGSAAYKRALAKQLLAAHFIKLFPGTLTLDDVVDARFLATKEASP